ncbi:uncharacterized protein LOC128954197 [Oppia nitens]|uniref:uncharacterized protein LOC128954197 n=1 Tax=Oppia nitens TaxID=1686743 RepID=UPI0023DA47FD|nr:uncharacterized protein LOC128954197 [Oppia nitens]XP_054155746.1 uncharacterized protein LOC128954197 [Oppia nitens]
MGGQSTNFFLKIIIIVLSLVLAIVWAVQLYDLCVHSNWQPPDILAIIFMSISLMTILVTIYAAWFENASLCQSCMYVFGVQALILLVMLIIHIVASGNNRGYYVGSTVGLIIVLALLALVLFFYAKNIG